MTDTPAKNRASGDSRTPFLPNQQDTLWSGGRQSEAGQTARGVGVKDKSRIQANGKRK